ncbi:MAG: radical SAM protein [Paludibacteraceae bacterium]|nr:radical SAM protein [Paludibacteraceae bacterium]
MEITKTYRIKEIFYSLQGEGFHTGRAAVFVRFAGCNLRCPFCDTDFTGGEEMTKDEIVKRAQSANSSNSEVRMLLVLTGGEPSLQADEALVDALHEAGFYIAIETNGTHVLPNGIDWVTCSPKDAPVVLSRADEVKVVYRGQDVEEWYGKLKAQHYFLQPCDLHFESRSSGSNEGLQSYSTISETIAYILMHPHWQLSMQMHKVAGIR